MAASPDQRSLTALIPATVAKSLYAVVLQGGLRGWRSELNSRTVCFNTFSKEVGQTKKTLLLDCRATIISFFVR